MKLQLFNYTGSVFLCDFPSQAGLSAEGRRIWKVINAYCGLTSREKFVWGVTQYLGATGIYGSDESPCIAGCIRLSPAGHISTQKKKRNKFQHFSIFYFFNWVTFLFYSTKCGIPPTPPKKKAPSGMSCPDTRRDVFVAGAGWLVLAVHQASRLLWPVTAHRRAKSSADNDTRESARR